MPRALAVFRLTSNSSLCGKLNRKFPGRSAFPDFVHVRSGPPKVIAKVYSVANHAARTRHAHETYRCLVDRSAALHQMTLRQRTKSVSASGKPNSLASFPFDRTSTHLPRHSL